MKKMFIFMTLLPLSLDAAFGSLGTLLKLISKRQHIPHQPLRTFFNPRTLEENVVLCDLIIKDLDEQRILLSSIHPDLKKAFKICLNILAHATNPEFPLVTLPVWQPSVFCIVIAQGLLAARQQRVILRAHDLLQQEPQRSCECPRSAALAVLSGIRTFEEDAVTKALARSYEKRLITEETLPECPFCE